MDTKIVNYQEEKKVYYKILLGLLLLTAITFIQPHMFMQNSTFLAQMFIAVIKAWLILIYYMHLKGEKLIALMVWFAIALVAVFFVIVVGFDVANFQYGAESHITASSSAGAEHTAPVHQ